MEHEIKKAFSVHKIILTTSVQKKQYLLKQYEPGEKGFIDRKTDFNDPFSAFTEKNVIGFILMWEMRKGRRRRRRGSRSVGSCWRGTKYL